MSSLSGSSGSALRRNRRFEPLLVDLVGFARSFDLRDASSTTCLEFRIVLAQHAAVRLHATAARRRSRNRSRLVCSTWRSPAGEQRVVHHERSGAAGGERQERLAVILRADDVHAQALVLVHLAKQALGRGAGGRDDRLALQVGPVLDARSFLVIRRVPITKIVFENGTCC
jgi:hypothetical protein